MPGRNAVSSMRWIRIDWWARRKRGFRHGSELTESAEAKRRVTMRARSSSLTVVLTTVLLASVALAGHAPRRQRRRRTASAPTAAAPAAEGRAGRVRPVRGRRELAAAARPTARTASSTTAGPGVRPAPSTPRLRIGSGSPCAASCRCRPARSPGRRTACSIRRAATPPATTMALAPRVNRPKSAGGSGAITTCSSWSIGTANRCSTGRSTTSCST